MDFDYDKYLKSCDVQFIAYGMEVCPTTGRSHHQGWVYFPVQRTSRKKVASELGNSHVEGCRGSLLQNVRYCSKGKQYIELGVKPQQGLRTDLKRTVDEVVAGNVTAEEICLEDPVFYHQYGRTLHKAEDIALRKKFRTEMTKGIWYCGETGVGKSHKAFEGFDPTTHYVFKTDGGWWDGYTGQETVIVNEFRGGIAYSELLDLVDKWPKEVRRRGREPVPFLAQKLIVTSVLRPEEVYNNLADNDSLAQMYRRFDVIELKARKPGCLENHFGSEVL